MDKKHEGTSSQSLSDTPSPKTKTNSRPAGTRSDRTGIWVNERGETCYGDKCVQLTFDEERNEARVLVKRTSTCDTEPLVQVIKRLFDKPGTRTVYEIESEIREESK